MDDKTIKMAFTGRKAHPVHLFELPFKSRRITVSQMWHPRMERDHGHLWLREQILAICGVERSDMIKGSV